MKSIVTDISDDDQNKKNENEINIFKSLNHPYIIRYYESFIKDNKLCIVMDLAQGGDLTNIINEYIKTGESIEEDKVYTNKIDMAMVSSALHGYKVHTLQEDTTSRY